MWSLWFGDVDLHLQRWKTGAVQCYISSGAQFGVLLSNLTKLVKCSQKSFIKINKSQHLEGTDQCWKEWIKKTSVQMSNSNDAFTRSFTLILSINIVKFFWIVEITLSNSFENNVGTTFVTLSILHSQEYIINITLSNKQLHSGPVN